LSLKCVEMLDKLKAVDFGDDEINDLEIKMFVLK
jgi:hypothetical protein